MLKRRYWKKLLLVLLAGVIGVYGLFSLIRGLERAAVTTCDFDAFWATAILLNEGQSPYRAWLENGALLDNQYAVTGDGYYTCDAALSVRPFFSTPVYALLVLPFSLLDYDTAGLLWSVVQIALAAAVVWTAFELSPAPPGYPVRLLGLMLFFAWVPTRNTFSLGQLSLLTIFSAFFGIWLLEREKPRPVWAGIFMGIALSKFTLSLPLLLLFIVYRRYKSLTIALLTQVVGFILFSLIVREPLFEVVKSYAALLGSAFGQDLRVVSLDGWLSLAGMPGMLSSVISGIVGILVVVAFVLPHYWQEILGKKVEKPAGYHRLKFYILFVITVFVTILSIYHRVYDLSILFVCVILVFWLLRELPHATDRASRWLAISLTAAGLVLVGVFLIPPGIYETLLPEPLSLMVAAASVTVSLILVLGVSIRALNQLDLLALLLPDV